MPDVYKLDRLGRAFWTNMTKKQKVTWAPRYTDEIFVDRGAAFLPDPHDVFGVARCPTCYDSYGQESGSSICTTCYGTTWNGGYSSLIGLRALVTEDDVQLRVIETGETLVAPGIWMKHNARYKILPKDLLIINQFPNVRYIVGETVRMWGYTPDPYARMVNLLPLGNDDPHRLFPMIPVDS